MATDPLFRNGASCFVALIMTASVMSGQTSVKRDTAARTITTSPTEQFSEADSLRGTYGPYRANNDLLYYHLDVRVDPERKFLSGKNTIRFRMLEDGTRIQLDLVTAFSIDKVLLDGANGATTPLKFVRAAGRTVYVDFPHILKKGETYSIEFHYSGNPVEWGASAGLCSPRTHRVAHW